MGRGSRGCVLRVEGRGLYVEGDMKVTYILLTFQTLDAILY